MTNAFRTTHNNGQGIQPRNGRVSKTNGNERPKTETIIAAENNTCDSIQTKKKTKNAFTAGETCLKQELQGKRTPLERRVQAAQKGLSTTNYKFAPSDDYGTTANGKWTFLMSIICCGVINRRSVFSSSITPTSLSHTQHSNTTQNKKRSIRQELKHENIQQHNANRPAQFENGGARRLPNDVTRVAEGRTKRLNNKPRA